MSSSPSFRRLFAARAISFVGDGAAATALILYVESESDSGIVVGALLLAQSLPYLFAPVVGAVADRVDRRALAAGAELGQAILFAIIATLPPIPVIALLVAMASFLASASATTGHALVPALVDKEHLTQANAWLGTALNLQIVLGPALGGILTQTVGVEAALLVNAASFAVAGAMVWTVRLRRRPPRPETQPGIVASVREGASFALRHRQVRVVIVGLFLAVAFAGMDDVALVFLARDVLETGSVGFGIILSSYGAGMIAASSVLVWLGSRLRPRTLFSVGLGATGIGALITGVAPVAPVAAGGQAVAGSGNALDNVATDTLVQQAVPPEMLGRVFGLRSSAARLGGALARLGGGLLVDATSARVVFVVAGAGACLVALWVGLALRGEAGSTE